MYGVALRPTPVSVDTDQLQVGVVFVFTLLLAGVPGTLGAVVSTITLPAVLKLELLPVASVVKTREYHVPSVNTVLCVNEEVLLVEADTLLLKLTLGDHCSVYGVGANPDPESVDAVHVQVGVAELVGLVVTGVPGVVGAEVSTLKATPPELAVA